MILALIKFFYRCTSAIGRRLYRAIRRLKLKNTPGARLEDGYLDSFELMELVKAEIGKDDIVIYDIGGHIGTWTVLAKSIFLKSKVHVFEPLAIHWKELEENVNNIPDVFLEKCALGNKAEVIKMHVASNSDSSSFLPLTENIRNEFGQVQTDEVGIEVVRLDDYIRTKGIRTPDVIKIDVQGFELEVLKGATTILSHAKYLIIEVSFIELYEFQPLFSEVTAFLRDHGFNVYAFGNNTALGKRIIQTDVLFKSVNS